jgi:hypothetical protein
LPAHALVQRYQTVVFQIGRPHSHRSLGYHQPEGPARSSGHNRELTREKLATVSFGAIPFASVGGRGAPQPHTQQLRLI